jgi:hypothetical protein
LLNALQVVLKSVPPLQWSWGLRRETGPLVAVSGHAYDRQLRCEQASKSFLGHAEAARINTTVMVFPIRSWA